MKERNDFLISLDTSAVPSSFGGPLLDTSDSDKNPIHFSDDETILPLRVRGSLGYLSGWSRNSRASLAVQIVFPVAAFGLVFAACELGLANRQHSRLLFPWTLSLLAASLALCLVRWLRCIQLRSLDSNGSRRNRQDSVVSINSRQAFEGDSIMELCQLRDESQQRKHEKRLKLADDRFENYHRRSRLIRQDLSLESEPSSTYGSGGMLAATLARTEYSCRTASMEMSQPIQLSSGPVQRRTYAHGGLFGAAPMMLANPQWVGILRRLMPDVYIELSN